MKKRDFLKIIGLIPFVDPLKIIEDYPNTDYENAISLSLTELEKHKDRLGSRAIYLTLGDKVVAIGTKWKIAKPQKGSAMLFNLEPYFIDNAALKEAMNNTTEVECHVYFGKSYYKGIAYISSAAFKPDHEFTIRSSCYKLTIGYIEELKRYKIS